SFILHHSSLATMIVDAHLDLAYNMTRRRDPRVWAKDQPVVQSDVAEIATVGLPDLRAGGVGLICATIFCAPAGCGDRGGYTTAASASSAWPGGALATPAAPARPDRSPRKVVHLSKSSTASASFTMHRISPSNRSGTCWS